jgi:hypothetical protein
MGASNNYVEKKREWGQQKVHGCVKGIDNVKFSFLSP